MGQMRAITAATGQEESKLQRQHLYTKCASVQSYVRTHTLVKLINTPIHQVCVCLQSAAAGLNHVVGVRDGVV